MGKISPVSAKYIIHTDIQIDGAVDRPDVIGAIFGQTEGLLGADLELRELQRSGRIGRIEVNVEVKTGKTKGSIIIPSSLDKAETSIIAAALEIIQRIGPCNAQIKVENIEDVRVSKRSYVIERAKELLHNMMETVIPDSQEIADEVAHSVRMMEIQEYGKDRVPAGPALEESDEIIVVEGRADVLNLLKHGFKNCVAINGTNIPPTVVELCKRKIVTVFVDGDRGGDLIIRELTSLVDIDFVAKAPDGKEVEEITKKEIHKAIRSRASVEQVTLEQGNSNGESTHQRNDRDDNQQNRYNNNKRWQNPQQQQQRRPYPQQSTQQTAQAPQSQPQQAIEPKAKISNEERAKFKSMLDDMVGTRGAYVLDNKLNVLGKVPINELSSTIKNLTSSSVYAIIFDGTADKELIPIAEKVDIKHLICMDKKLENIKTKINIMTQTDFQQSQ